ncbi:hypothetical protein D0962_13360 [Leptolyngbyaceae cyanobacterium CCMR0082]|uniref:Uncharacterized protein n=2 Tax=Adonisia turfae TaxID=2950184 RepID=A0A6M0S7F6_9CYAN|nr:hypothetical protein [Adonisia turfae]MDV3353495.1 hypothetical protein [Leptothoe sp. LEGE 181152]NEZ56753.1 hypothetical protein [Adonisia turfae CCMR0081]NEZ63762.1 hypothetical protein [Adonisia turfae CCMR0082]
MRPISKRPQQIADSQYQALSTQHLFSQYMLQDQMRDQVFMASLSTFKAELQRIKKSASLRHASLDWYLDELNELRQQFDTYVSTLRRKGLIQFTLPMELALFATRSQWFINYQGPQIRRGWQQAAQGFQQMSNPEK